MNREPYVCCFCKGKIFSHLTAAVDERGLVCLLCQRKGILPEKIERIPPPRPTSPLPRMGSWGGRKTVKSISRF